MASWAFKRDLAPLRELKEEPLAEEWRFQAMPKETSSTGVTADRREEVLAVLRAGSKVQI